MKKIRSLDDLLLHQVADLYEVEKEQLKMLPWLTARVKSPEMAAIIGDHVINIKQELQLIENNITQPGTKIYKTATRIIDDMVDRAGKIMRNSLTGYIIETELALFVQYINHFEIANIYTLVGLSNALRKKELTNLLEKILSDKRGIDYRLSRLSQDRITELHAV